ncbi:arylsulfatase A-like enzyme [Algisphaera agarilytica]|uniref:Arylsulfatase A-like enzyme n=1 Tax=Algisphaera agarilytica TaxID=1385975 RepID=A0A7X0H8E4_9BACT|nr:arylsulfatase A-like enzyme [Algisphaera agarilytica]
MLQGACARGEVARPNVVLIYGDDVGYADIGVNGATVIPTPHIDRLASRSLNFTDGHAPSATCTPSRFSMLTGVHAFRQGVRIAPPNASLLIDPDAMTLPRLFQDAGYNTGLVGKWHLGLGDKEAGPQWNGELKPGPIELGFDDVFMMPTTNDRVPCVYVEGHRVVGLDPDDPIHVGKKYEDVDLPGSTQYPTWDKGPVYHSVINGIGRIGYMSGGKSALWDDRTMADVFVKQAKEFLSKQSTEEPFFLYFSSQDIHVPNTPHQRFQGKTKYGVRGDAMVQFDWSVGQIVGELERLGLSDNTIIILTSDNGPTQHDDSYPSTPQVQRYSHRHNKGHDASGPWRGGKYEIYEGGTRIPFMVSWPGVIEPGRSDAMVNQIDFVASFASLLEIELADDQAIDSRDTWDAFAGSDPVGLSLILEEGRSVALRMNQWKYIPAMDPKWGQGFWPEEDQLFNLENDRGEQANLIASEHEKAESMREVLEALRGDQGVRAAVTNFDAN